MQCYLPIAPPPLTFGSGWLYQSGGQLNVPINSIQSDTLNTLRCLLKDMLHSLESSISAIKATTGCVNRELTNQLEAIQAVQRAYWSQVEVVCLDLSSQRQTAAVAGGEGSGPASVGVDWLLKQEELEEEKTCLHKRLLKSETAHSETKSKLESARLKTSQLLKDLEWQKSQCSALKLELQQKAEASKRLSAKNEALKMELAKIRTSNDQHHKSEEEIAALQNQLNGLNGIQKELGLCRDELIRTRQLLESAQEDVQLTKMSLSEKNVELLEAQDKLLEIRQCLAYFLSELKPVNSSHDHTVYSVSPEAVHRFRSLVDTGNATEFTAFYRARMGSEQHGDVLEKGSSPASTTSSSSTLVSSSPPSCHESSVQGKKPRVTNGNIGTAICIPLTEASSVLTSVTTSTEQDFRRDLATLDADIARLHLQFKVAQQTT